MMDVGRASPTGEGELVLQTFDRADAESLHDELLAYTLFSPSLYFTFSRHTSFMIMNETQFLMQISQSKTQSQPQVLYKYTSTAAISAPVAPEKT